MTKKENKTKQKFKKKFKKVLIEKLNECSIHIYYARWISNKGNIIIKLIIKTFKMLMFLNQFNIAM